MTVTLRVPTRYLTDLTARNGLPAKATIPQTLCGQQVWLVARRKQAVYVPLGRPITETEAEDPATGTPAQVRVKVPSWTRWLRWGVLAEADDGDATAYCQRTEIDAAAAVETYQHAVPCPGIGAGTAASGALYLSDGVADADDLAQDIDCGTASASWKLLTLSVWVAGGATVYGLILEPQPMAEITG